MRSLALRAQQTRAPLAEETVRGFFTELGAGAFAQARRRAAPTLEWLGGRLDAAAWDGPRLRRWASAERLTVSRVRALSPAAIEAFPRYAIERVFGPLDPTDSVVFADLTRGETVTVIVIVSMACPSAPRILRVLDPEPFADFVDFAAVMGRIEPRN